MENLATDLAREREQKAAAEARPLTIQQAIEHAKWVRGTPDGFLDPTVARKTIDALLAGIESSRCFYNALVRGQAVFVLVQQDRASPVAIQCWANLAYAHGCEAQKVDQAYALARAWRAQPDDKTKWPT